MGPPSRPLASSLLSPGRGVAGVALLAAVLAGCATNPATGETQLSLISEKREIEMGRQAASDVERTVGLYDDASLREYVEQVATGEARASERPDLPWSFEVLDDPVVNAFALPGGFIYVTRGILPYFQSEAELAFVLGHEIGHVTARHSVEQMSRSRLARIGLGLGSLFVEEVRQFGGLFEAGLGVLFLKYGREDERQADRLGLRYMTAEGYATGESLDVLRMLGRQREESGGSSLPSWLSTHPSAENRIRELRAAVDSLRSSAARGRVARDRYLERMDGLVFGPDPRNGFFRENEFLHPELEIRAAFPPGWSRRNMASAVVARSPDEAAVVELGLADTAGHRAAARRFFGQDGVRGADVAQQQVNGRPATAGRFVARSGNRRVRGYAAFVDLGGRTYRLMGYAGEASYSEHAGAIREFAGSLDRLTDPEALEVQPMRIDLLTVDRRTTVAELAERRSPPVSAETLALLNARSVDEAVGAGTTLKWVVGERPPGSR